jgi:hypothetical protein
MAIETENVDRLVGSNRPRPVCSTSSVVGPEGSPTAIAQLANTKKSSQQHTTPFRECTWITRIENGADAKQSTMDSLQHALEVAGVELIEENGGAPGVRLRKRQQRMDYAAGVEFTNSDQPGVRLKKGGADRF